MSTLKQIERQGRICFTGSKRPNDIYIIGNLGHYHVASSPGAFYRHVLDFSKESKYPPELSEISIIKATGDESDIVYASSIRINLLENIPLALREFGILPRTGATFKEAIEEAGRKYGERYKDFFVSVIRSTGEKFMLRLPEVLLDENNKEQPVLEAKSKLILGLISDKDATTLDYVRDRARNETVVTIGEGARLVSDDYFSVNYGYSLNKSEGNWFGFFTFGHFSAWFEDSYSGAPRYTHGRVEEVVRTL